MNDDLMPPVSEPVVTVPTDPPRPTPSNRIKCDFCACQLAPNGDVMSMSAQARKFRDQEEAIVKLHKDLVDAEETHRAQTRELTEELERARAVLIRPADPTRKGFFD